MLKYRNTVMPTMLTNDDTSALYLRDAESTKKTPHLSDVLENDIRINMPCILEILLLDRTSSTPDIQQNIIWANDNYIKHDADVYAPTAQIKPDLITDQQDFLILPRSLKTKDLQKERTKSKAEVFTPAWVVNKQNDAADENYMDDDIETYTRRKWLEIACGEAPYMATRYDMETGELIPIDERVGFVDRKLARINNEISAKAEWQRLAELAYQSSYGFEWNGDSLLLARENLLYTYRDYYMEKWDEEPPYALIEVIAIIISYNVFQMDGLTFTIPLSEKMEKVVEFQPSLTDTDTPEEEWRIIPNSATRVKIMNWDTHTMEFFDREIKRA